MKHCLRIVKSLEQIHERTLVPVQAMRELLIVLGE
jgi:hypothetical protein